MKLTILFLTCLCLHAHGQDYVITNQSDTLRGKVKPLYQEQVDRVQITVDKKKKSFSALEVREITYQSKIYRPVSFQNTARFMRLEKPGYLKLYSFRVENQMTFGGRYLQKSDGSGIEVPNLMFKKKMVEFLRDDNEVADKIDKGTYGRSDLEKIIDEYNAHIAQETESRKTEGADAFVANQKLALLEELRKEIEKQPEFPTRKDALDLLNDIAGKLKSSEAIPNYMIEGLKSALASVEPVQDELGKFLESK